MHELAAPGLHLEVQAQQCQWEQLESWLLGWPGATVVDHRGLPAALSLSYPGSAVLSRLLAGQHVWAERGHALSFGAAGGHCDGA